jgi:hypothetical protein
MAASPSAKRISEVRRYNLKRLQSKLAKAGVESQYINGQFRLEVRGANVQQAWYRLLRASNGECALYPVIAYLDGKSYEGWDAFDKIVKAWP